MRAIWKIFAGFIFGALLLVACGGSGGEPVKQDVADLPTPEELACRGASDSGAARFAGGGRVDEQRGERVGERFPPPVWHQFGDRFL